MAREGLVYSTPSGHGGFSVAAAAAKATLYATLTALAALADAALVRFDEPEESGRPIRVNLSMTGEGSDGHTVGEDLYLVFRTSLDGQAAVRLQKLGAATYTLGADLVGQGARGEGDSLRWAKAAAFVSTGLDLALTGGALAVTPFPEGEGGAGNMAGLALYDVGPAVALLRVPHRGASATLVHPVHERWA